MAVPLLYFFFQNATQVLRKNFKTTLSFIWQTMVYSCSKIAITKYHQNRQKSFSHSSAGQRSKTKMLTGHISTEPCRGEPSLATPSLLGVPTLLGNPLHTAAALQPRAPLPHGALPSGLGCLLVSSFYNDPSHIGLRVHPISE